MQIVYPTLGPFLSQKMFKKWQLLFLNTTFWRFDYVFGGGIFILYLVWQPKKTPYSVIKSFSNIICRSVSPNDQHILGLVERKLHNPMDET